MRIKRLRDEFSWFLSFAPPLISALLVMWGVGFYFTFISLYFTYLGYSEIVVGVIQASYFFGLFVGAWFLEGFVRRVGHIQVLAFSGSLLSASVLLQALSQGVFYWIVTRFFAGIAIAAFYVVIECWMLDHTKSTQRGLALSLYMLTLNSGYILGQSVVPFVSFNTTDAFIFAALLIGTSILPVALSTRRLTSPRQEHGIKLINLFRFSPFGTSGCFLSGLLIGALYSFLALTSELGAKLVALLVLGGLIAQWPLGRLSDLVDRRKVMLGVCVLILCSSVFLFFNHGASEIFQVALIFALGAGVFTLYPISLAQVTDQLDHDQLAAGSSCLLLAYGAGSVLGPLISSLIMEAFGLTGLFLFVGVMTLAISAVGIKSLICRNPIPREEKEDFVVVPRTSIVVAELDPRSN